MKDLIKKQEEVVNDIVGRIRYWDTERKEMLREGLLELVSEVRKETAEAVADKMIGTTLEERSDFFSFSINKLEKRFFVEGYNQKLKEEKELKKSIIESL